MISNTLCNSHSHHNHHFAFVILRRYWGLMALVSVLFAGACKQRSDIEQDNLYGKWDILDAMRNGNVTQYLRGGYFIIDANGTMTVNLTGSDETGPYTLQDKTLRVSNAKDFTIESLKGDSMTMRYIMSPQSDFLIHLIKHKDEAR